MTHTPTPWRTEQRGSAIAIVDARGNTIVCTPDNGTTNGMEDLRSGRTQKRATHIVLACNSHAANLARIAELEAALREIQSLLAGPRSEGKQWECEAIARVALNARPA